MRKRKLSLPIFAMLVTLLATQTIPYANASQIVYLHSSEPFVQMGQASWYSEQSPGINKYTANNEVFDDNDFTAAMWDVPFNQRIRVTNLANGKSVIVRVNDRGPHRRFVETGRIIDLTKQAFATIASLDQGLIDIELEIL
jgi:rare lipoprotein A